LIYFLRVDGGAIKIGFSADDKLHKRLRVIRTSCPGPVTCLGVMAGDKIVERDLHLRFLPHHVYGEWFSPVDELLEFIRENTTSVVLPPRRKLVPARPKRIASGRRCGVGVPRVKRYGRPGRPSLGDDKLSRFMMIRVTSDEKALLEAKAREDGLRLAEWARKIALEECDRLGIR
jgi:hypothetical protein